MHTHTPGRSVLACHTLRRAAFVGLTWAIGAVVVPVAAQAASAGSPTHAAASADGRSTCPPSWLGETTAANPTISADGRFVAFEQYTGDPEAGDVRDVMLRDLRRHTTRAITRFEAPESAFFPVISDTGNRVAYLRLDPASPAGESRLVMFDRRTGHSTDEGRAFAALAPDVSTDGRYVAFTRIRIEGTGENEARIADVYRRDVDRDRTVLVSTTPGGHGGNGSSIDPTISADGRFVLFSSQASDLTTDGSGAQGGLYLRDLRTGTTTVIPGRDGDVSSAAGYGPRLSPDGRYVLYLNDGAWVYDRRTGTTTAASEPPSETYNVNSIADISRNGRKVAFSVNYLVGDEGNGEVFSPVLARTVRSGAETVVSVGPDGVLEPFGGSFLGGITPNGRYVTFYSTATNLDPRDGDSTLDVYVRDLRRGRTTLVSTPDAGAGCG